jgi:hypothetical protein
LVSFGRLVLFRKLDRIQARPEIAAGKSGACVEKVSLIARANLACVVLFFFPLSGGPDSKARDGRRARRKAPEGHATGCGM